MHSNTPESGAQQRPHVGHQLRLHGAGRPLVYVPGIDGTGSLFFTQLARLTGDYRVATYRLRDSATHMDELIGDLADVVRHASGDGEPATLVSESFGGALAMSFALRHPQLVRSLVVLNSFARFRDPWQLHVAAGSMQLFPWSLTRRIREFNARRLHSPSTPREHVERALALSSTSTRIGYRNRLRMLSRYDLREQLPQIRVPTLYLAADQDTLIPSVAQARYMASRVPGAQLRVLEGQGHACLISPEVNVHALLRDWTDHPHQSSDSRANTD